MAAKKRRKVAHSEPRLVAVIDVGSSAIRMVVAEVAGPDEWSILDSAERAVTLGSDVFVEGEISRESMKQSLQILTGFCEILNGWQVPSHNVRAIATSALREARNRDTFIDRVGLRTGLQITCIEGIEANHLTFLAVEHAFKSRWRHFHLANSIVIEVGGGSTEVMMLQRGKMVAAHSLNIGTIRIDRQIRSTLGSRAFLNSFLRENVSGTFEFLNEELPLKRIRHFVAVGGDARLVCRLIGRSAAEHHAIMEKDDYIAFVRNLEGMSIDEIVRRYQIPYDDAEPLLPALLVYQQFLEVTSAKQMIVPDVSIRDGMLVHLSRGDSDALEEELYSQVVASAVTLGRRYHFDEQHALHVADLAMFMFDHLQDEHGLNRFHRLLLRVAAILHEIGKYVNQSGHHKHGQYLIENSELFGLDRDDIRIVSNVVRYHRKSKPVPSHTLFVSLDRDARLVVMKLGAILRVVDALERRHNQDITSLSVEKTDDELIIRCPYDGDLTAERFSMIKKADMFEEVFGYRVVLEARRFGETD